ncbi:MAG: SCO family protein [Chitinophagales bacterium]|nr:SCO family protein [Chitinophagales bacterium]
MNKSKLSFWIAIIIVIVFPISFGYYFWQKGHQPILPESVLPIYGKKQPFETVNSKGEKVIDTIFHTIPKFAFTDHLNRPFTKKDMNNTVWITNFFFSTCPTICKDMTRNLRTVQSHFIEDEEVRILSHTVDPETDTVGQLYRYAQENQINSDKWLLLTGNKAEIYNIARQGYMVTATVGDGGPNDFIHSEKLILIDREGRIRGYYDGTDSLDVQRLIKDTEKLLVAYVVPRKTHGDE